MKTQDVIRKCRENRDDKGVAAIENKEVAVLIRDQLRRRFPGTKFSVRCGRGDSVTAYWTDGPCGLAVESVIGCYSFGGFDGMIDLAYSSDNWLLPDGTMEAAASQGTEGSMGMVPGYATDCPQPGAVLVKYGPHYVFAQRTVTDDRYRVLATLVERSHGWTVDFSQPLWQQQYPNGEYVPSYLRQMERRAWEEREESREYATA